LILETDGCATRPDFAAYVEGKAVLLLRHLHARGGVVRVYMAPVRTMQSAEFLVCAVAEKTGIDHVAHATAPDPEWAVDEAFAKLERVLAIAAGLRRRTRARP
jgi:hypothetical protein